MDSNTITSPSEYEAAIQRAHQGKLIVISIWSDSSPICRQAAPQVDQLSSEYPQAEFFKMELTASTQPMVKFGVQNTPIFIVTQGAWATTVLGANLKQLEAAIRQKMS